MPPLARLRVSALDDLARQLRYASADALARDIDNAEALAAEIDPDALYDEAWIVQRITGHAVHLEEPSSVVGAALLSDLSALVERLSSTARRPLADLGEGALRAGELQDRWSVSRRTLDRYRRQGLIAQRVLDARGRSTLAFTARSIERFERSNADLLERAASFSRIDPDLEERLIERARRYRARLNWSSSRIAARLGERYQRSPEAIRQLLQRHDQRPGEAPIFDGAGEIGPRERRLAHRAVQVRGLEPQAVARRLHATTPATRRAVAHHRLALLKQLDLSGPMAAWFGDLAMERKALEPAPVREGLGRPLPTGLVDLVAQMRACPPPIGAVERTRLAALHVLRSRASAVAESIRAPVPPVALLDRAEADLLWASRLKGELIRDHLGTILRAIEQRAERPIDELGGSGAARAIGLALRAASRAIDRFNPFAGERRLAAPLLLAIDAALASERLAAPSATGKAAAALPRGARLDDPLRSLDPWQRWLEPLAVVADAARAGDDEQAALLCARFGIWPDETPDEAAQRPMSVEELAAARSVTRIVLGRSVRKAIRDARSRGQAQPAGTDDGTDDAIE